MSVLVTGGAGYIGSHTTYALLDRGDEVVVLDNLSNGVRSSVGLAATFVEGEVADQALVRDLIARHRIDAVIHFAGSAIVPESVERPLDYYRNNTVATRNLIETCVAANVSKFIFSSTAAVYASTTLGNISESADKQPMNPYGRSKLMTEWMLEDTAIAHDFRYIALRYFNVAGADAQGRTGQSSRISTHLVKRACQAALDRIPHLDLFGTDFATPDGTAVRDYIHVTDLAQAHLLALDALRAGAGSQVFNCGYGRGFTVRQVIAAVERAAAKPLRVREQPRRAGDPPSLVADSTRLRSELGWIPHHDDIDEIVRSALEWERRFNV